jgi:hypothetical protein
MYRNLSKANIFVTKVIHFWLNYDKYRNVELYEKFTFRPSQISGFKDFEDDRQMCLFQGPTDNTSTIMIFILKKVLMYFSASWQINVSFVDEKLSLSVDFFLDRPAAIFTDFTLKLSRHSIDNDTTKPRKKKTAYTHAFKIIIIMRTERGPQSSADLWCGELVYYMPSSWLRSLFSHRLHVTCRLLEYQLSDFIV